MHEPLRVTPALRWSRRGTNRHLLRRQRADRRPCRPDGRCSRRSSRSAPDASSVRVCSVVVVAPHSLHHGAVSGFRAINPLNLHPARVRGGAADADSRPALMAGAPVNAADAMAVASDRGRRQTERVASAIRGGYSPRARIAEPVTPARRWVVAGCLLPTGGRPLHETQRISP